MRELIKGVTKIKWIGVENPQVESYLWFHREGIYIGKEMGSHWWQSPEGVYFTYGTVDTLLGEGTLCELSEVSHTTLPDNSTYTECPVKSTGGWSAKHYDHYYHLTPQDIADGKIRLDAYTVSKVWKIGSKDDSGALWHTFKLFPRWGEKNSIEREIRALYAQTKALAKIYNVKLGD